MKLNIIKNIIAILSIIIIIVSILIAHIGVTKLLIIVPIYSNIVLEVIAKIIIFISLYTLFKLMLCEIIVSFDKFINGKDKNK